MVPQPEDRLERAETLEERLQRGHLPLSIAVHHAYAIARALHQIHKNGQAHGSVTGRAIELRPTSAVLLVSAGGLQPKSACPSDIRGFGSVLQSLFPDQPPQAPPGPSPPWPGTPQPGTSAMGVWEAARQIAGRCLADPPQAGWTVRKLVGELRLLNIVARQWAWRAQFPAALQPQGPRIRREAAPKFEREAGTLSLAPPTPAAPPPAQAATPSSALEFGRTVRQPRMSAVRCPRCGAAEIRPSNPRSDFEETLEFWHMPVLQCHNCSFRYFRFLFLKIRKAAQD